MRALIGDQWSDGWDVIDDDVPSLEVECEWQETHYQVLGPDGEPIRKPTIRFGFWPNRELL